MSEPSLLTAAGLSWSTPAGRPVLRGVDLTLRSGDVLTVTGPSGSGKSTLLRCLVLLEDGGSVSWRGAVVGPGQVLALRRAVRLVPQRPVAVSHTLHDELCLARRAAPEGLDEAGQKVLLARLGLGSAPAAQAFDRFSGGEQQRIALVRALTGLPQVLLLDEPTSSLDPEHRALAERVLLDHLRTPGRAAVWVTHDDAQAARVGTRVLTLERA